MTGSNNYFSLISLNINGLNFPIKRHRLTDWLHKQDPTFCCLQETNPGIKTDTTSELKAGKLWEADVATWAKMLTAETSGHFPGQRIQVRPAREHIA
jgi:exonuclease III